MNHDVTDPNLSHHKQHKLQANTHFPPPLNFSGGEYFSSLFFARRKLLFHFPAELLLRHLQSNLCAESSLSLEQLSLPALDGLQFR